MENLENFSFYITQKCMYCNNTRNVPYIPYDWMCDYCRDRLNKYGYLLIDTEHGKARVTKQGDGMMMEYLSWKSTKK